MGNLAEFDWAEYSVFSFMLLLSTLIGVYFGCFQGGQDTVDGYLLGGKQMSVFPIAMSLIATYISGITLLGVPTEIYTYGTQYLLANIANYVVAALTIVIVLPVVYKLQLISLYEYLAIRFNRTVRLAVSFFYTLGLLFYIPIVIYGPALALNQGMNVHLVTPIICSVCIFYTTLGGLKAVVWSDALQGAVMLGSVIVVIILGTVRVGGVQAVIDIANDGDRFEIFNMDADPTTRLSFWSSSFGLTFFWFANFAVSPAAAQRFIALPTYRQAQMSVVYLGLGVSAFITLCGITGLIMYAEFKDCDPLTSGLIKRPDQILPYFVLLIAGNVRGLPGVFLAGIVCAALSSMSTCLNTLAGTFYEDFIEPLFKKKPSEKKASFIMKILVVVFGCVCVFLVTIIEKLGAILEISVGFGSVASGATLGIFLLGMLFPCSNAKGALVGGFVSLLFMMWLLLGSTIARANGLLSHKTKILSVDNCTHPFNATTIPPPTQEVFYLYRISIFYYCFMASSIVIVVGLLTSWATGFNKKDIDPDLISPVARKYLPNKSHYNAVPLKVITS